jgi:hypothetical protein
MTQHRKIESLVVLLGAAITAAGAVLIQPVAMAVGVAIVAIATIKRILDRSKQRAHATHPPEGAIPLPL